MLHELNIYTRVPVISQNKLYICTLILRCSTLGLLQLLFSVSKFVFISNLTLFPSKKTEL